MTRDDVQAWLDRYVAAWKSYDPAAIGDLFSRGVEYRYHPWDEAVVGRDAVVRSWMEPDGVASSRDEPDTYDAVYRPYAIDGDRAVAVGRSDYFDEPSGALRERFHNVFLLAFDEDGRCRSFTELYMQAPGR